MINDPLVGRRLANFQIERPLGRGGMAQVYFGQDVKLNRPVAIKVIDARFRNNPAYAERFVREAQAIARWRHEHIINIYYADDQEGLYYFVMEYIDGQDLAAILAGYADRGELMAYGEVIRIGKAVASALDYAHQQGVIHRDVKPSNVMVAYDGRVVLTDFGLAMDVEQGSMGEVSGTARYAAPEQARHSANALPQSDLYSLGVMLYEMLTGRVPFDDPSSTAVALQHVTLPPPPPREINPNLNQATEAVLLKALSKKPEERYQSGQELIEALATALGLARPSYLEPGMLPPVTDPAARALPATAPTTGRSRALLFAGAGLGLLLLAGLVVLLLLAGLFWFRSGEAEPVAAGSQDSPTATLTSAAGPAGLAETPTAEPPTPTLTVAVEAAAPPTSTPEPPTPTPEPPTATPTPTVPPAPQYSLVIARGERDSLFLINPTELPLPLAGLALGNDEGFIEGTDWDVDELAGGACVVAVRQSGDGDEDDDDDKGKGKGKDKNKKVEERAEQQVEIELPRELGCYRVVGRLLQVGEAEQFWNDPFGVYYAGNLIGACQEEEGPCLLLDLAFE